MSCHRRFIVCSIVCWCRPTSISVKRLNLSQFLGTNFKSAEVLTELLLYCVYLVYLSVVRCKFLLACLKKKNKFLAVFVLGDSGIGEESTHFIDENTDGRFYTEDESIHILLEFSHKYVLFPLIIGLLLLHLF